MKKCLLVLCALLIGMQAFAVEAVVPRYVKEMNDMCTKKLTVNNTYNDFTSCMMEAAQSDHLWRPGWATPVKADLYKLFASFGNVTYSAVDAPAVEALGTETAKKTMIYMAYKLQQLFASNGATNQKIDPRLIQIYRGY